MENTENFNIKIEGYEKKKRRKRKIDPKIEDAALRIVKRFLPTKLRASEKSLEIAYEKAQMLYNSGKYKEALPCFSILMASDPDNPKYAFARAACHHMMHEYKNAIQFYSVAAIMDNDSPLPFYYSSDCFIKMHDPFGALVTLDMGLKRNFNPEYAKIIQRMKSMVERLESELNEKKAQSSQSFINP